MQKIIKTEYSHSEIYLEDLSGDLKTANKVIEFAVVRFAKKHGVDWRQVQIRFFHTSRASVVEFSVDREETDEEFEARVIEVQKHKKKKICDSIRSLKKSIILMEEAGLGSENAELALAYLITNRNELQQRMNDFS